MTRFALIAPWYERWDKTPLLMERVLHESTRPPDIFWIIGETQADVDQAQIAYRDNGTTEVRFDALPTPRSGNGYAIIPSSRKINWVLDQLGEELIGYLDNLSMPHPTKYERMVGALEEHPEWGAVWCGQERTGRDSRSSVAGQVIEDAYCVLNYTQVIHRPTACRWPTDMAHAHLGEALLFRDMQQLEGVAWHPVGDDVMLDAHHFDPVSLAPPR